MFKEIGKKNSYRGSSIRTDDENTRKQIIKMLICIITIFFISWSPITLNNLLVSFDILPNVNHGILWYLRLGFFVLSYVNSCINPIVYTFMSKNFREGFRHIIGKVLKCMTKETKEINKSKTQETPKERKHYEMQKKCKRLVH